MSGNTEIEWTDKSFNPIRARLTAKGRAKFGVTKKEKVGHFCVHVSEGCRNCYAEKRQPYFGHGAADSYRQSYLDQGLIEVYLDEKELLAPLKWKKPCRVFPCSMTDLFGEWVPDAWIDRVLAVIALTPHITYQVLTKRSARMREYMSQNDAAGLKAKERVRRRMTGEGSGGYSPSWPLPNLHLGVSVEDQAAADQRIPDLLATPAAVRFLSAEPLLGAVDLRNICGGTFNALDGIDFEAIPSPASSGFKSDGKMETPGSAASLDWVIVGGESGPGARPMHPDWARNLRDQCVAAGVPFFMKQLSGKGGRAIKDMALFPEDLRIREFPRAL